MNELTAEEMRVVEYLIKDWEKQDRVTNIKQGIEACGFNYKHEMRMRIADYLRSLYAGNKVSSRRLKKWGPETLILTNEEKLAARCLLLHSRRWGEMPTTAKAAQDLGLSEKEVDTALDALNQLGFLHNHGSVAHPEYKLSADYKKFLEGVGLTIHEVLLEDGDRFNVLCSVDALILAFCVHNHQKVCIEDSCFHCVERIRVVINKGKVISQNPGGLRLFEGTDCGSTNFFSSEEHFQEWITNLLPSEFQSLCGPGNNKSKSIEEFKIARKY